MDFSRIMSNIRRAFVLMVGIISVIVFYVVWMKTLRVLSTVSKILTRFKIVMVSLCNKVSVETTELAKNIQNFQLTCLYGINYLVKSLKGFRDGLEQILWRENKKEFILIGSIVLLTFCLCITIEVARRNQILRYKAKVIPETTENLRKETLRVHEGMTKRETKKKTPGRVAALKRQFSRKSRGRGNKLVPARRNIRSKKRKLSLDTSNPKAKRTDSFETAERINDKDIVLLDKCEKKAACANSKDIRKQSEKSMLFRNKNIRLTSQSFDKSAFKAKLGNIIDSTKKTPGPRKKVANYKFKIMENSEDEINDSDVFQANDYDLSEVAEFSKYVKMLKFGVPAKGVLAQMEADGIEDPNLKMLTVPKKTQLESNSNTSEPPVRSGKQFEQMDKYERMLHLGVPQAVVEKRRQLDLMANLKPEVRKLRKSRGLGGVTRKSKMKESMLSALWRMISDFLAAIYFKFRPGKNDRKLRVRRKELKRRVVSMKHRSVPKMGTESMGGRSVKSQPIKTLQSGGDELISELKQKLNNRKRKMSSISAQFEL